MVDAAVIERCGDRLRAEPGGALRGTAATPGDKSVSHRALILAALADGESRIEGLLEAEDVLRTAAAIRAFGAGAERIAPGSWRVRGARWHSPPHGIDCGNSGTAARLLIGAAAGQRVAARFDGDASLRARPMDRVIDPLAAMGARIEGGPHLPVAVAARRLHGIRFVNEHASAQVKSALLLAGLGTEEAVEIAEPAPSRDHSERMLRAFGADVETSGGVVRLGARRRLRASDVAVPGDPSSAAFPIVAALIVPGSEVTLRGVMTNPLRTGLFETLQEMGADLRFSNRRGVGGEEEADVTARHSRLRGIEVPAERAPRMIDEYPALAIAAAFAEGKTVMRGLSELRVKESDRLERTAAGLAACGVAVSAEKDGLVVAGGPVRGGAGIETHGDHRIAMAFLTLGVAAETPVTVDRAAMIATSFPGFAKLMRGLGARIGGAA